MRMKPSSALAGRKPFDPFDRQAAWGCLTTNLALPGFGSIMGRRRAGYFQATLCVLGFVFSLTFGLRFFVWYLTNFSRINEAQDDPLASLNEIWMHTRWALLGMALFAASWFWALVTSLRLLRQSKQAGPADPPLITPEKISVSPSEKPGPPG